MRICDICMHPGSLKSVDLRDSTLGQSIWTSSERLDLCDSCIELFKSKSWIEIADRYRTALHRFIGEQVDERKEQT